jgi:hypothetical protein
MELTQELVLEPIKYKRKKGKIKIEISIIEKKPPKKEKPVTSPPPQENVCDCEINRRLKDESYIKDAEDEYKNLVTNTPEETIIIDLFQKLSIKKQEEEFFKLPDIIQHKLCSWFYVALIKVDGGRIKVFDFVKKTSDWYKELHRENVRLLLGDYSEKYSILNEYYRILNTLDNNPYRQHGKGYYIINALSMHDLDKAGIIRRVNKRFKMDPEEFKKGFIR